MAERRFRVPLLPRSRFRARSRRDDPRAGARLLREARLPPSRPPDAGALQLHARIWSVPTPTGAQMLPACGMAWGMQLDKKPIVVFTTIGDAATRQGDFYEAVCFAQERPLPVLFVVEDNGYGISSPTKNSRRSPSTCCRPKTGGSSTAPTWRCTGSGRRLATMRAGDGPVFLWVNMERLSSHTSSDDQKLYRSADEMAGLADGDPIASGTSADRRRTVTPRNSRRWTPTSRNGCGTISSKPMTRTIRARRSWNSKSSALPHFDRRQMLPPGNYRMGDTINLTLREGLDREPNRMIFGEDVEDPKGGVFRLTKRLSTDFPEPVFNSPLAESTILGVACGLASYGRRPVFELQFIDFIDPGWNQLITNSPTCAGERTAKWKCPVVIYAPYGAYLPGGSLWHSQANEAAIAHFPGINVVIPSTPEDAAGSCGPRCTRRIRRSCSCRNICSGSSGSPGAGRGGAVRQSPAIHRPATT